MKVEFGNLEIEWNEPSGLAVIAEQRNPVWRSLEKSPFWAEIRNSPPAEGTGDLGSILQLLLPLLAAGAEGFKRKDGKSAEGGLRLQLMSEVESWTFSELLSNLSEVVGIVGAPQVGGKQLNEKIAEAVDFFELAPGSS